MQALERRCLLCAAASPTPAAAPVAADPAPPLSPAVALPARHRASAAVTPRLGVLGDSYSDEYQFYGPDRRRARNWVELLATSGRADFGPFTTTSRGAPRDQGYANDWARSSATSDDLPAQAAGLAAQVAAGRIDYAALLVGGNDFLGAVSAADPFATLRRLPGHILARVRAAVSDILEAGPGVRMVIATVPDVRGLPLVQEARALGRVSAKLLRAADRAQAALNASLAYLGRHDARLAVADFATTAAILLTEPHLKVGGVEIDRATVGDDPRHLFLADGIHLGTVGQGLLANLFTGTLDAKFHAGLAGLTDAQILAGAGL